MIFFGSGTSPRIKILFFLFTFSMITNSLRIEPVLRIMNDPNVTATTTQPTNLTTTTERAVPGNTAVKFPS